MKIDKQLQSEFHGLRVLELEVKGITITKVDERLEALKIVIKEEARTNTQSLELIKDQPLFRAYRDFYWKVGIDPTKTRPAGEALTRRILGGKDIPTINTLVDSYNLVSIKTSIAIAAFDLGKINKDNLKLRKAHSAERFLGIGMKQPIALSGFEVVIDDETTNDLIAVYPYRDAEKSKVTEETTDVLLMMCGVPGISDPQLENASSLCQQYISAFCKQESKQIQ
ncbi:MAG: hypothetical protein JRN20_19555 [Nitrososphaerota archaeon]|nr:hypothetical protein [Nitrososphaerota archaeon]